VLGADFLEKRENPSKNNLLERRRDGLFDRMSDYFSVVLVSGSVL
jgi:hypothetical protein